MPLIMNHSDLARRAIKKKPSTLASLSLDPLLIPHSERIPKGIWFTPLARCLVHEKVKKRRGEEVPLQREDLLLPILGINRMN